MSYQILSHTADIRLKVKAETLKELFGQAAAGMTKILNPKTKSRKASLKRKISLEAPDKTALLVEFLNELLFLSQTHKETYKQIDFSQLTEKSLTAKLLGTQVTSFDEDIKAVTYHEANVYKNKNGQWQTTLVFDI